MELHDPPEKDAGWEAWLKYGRDVLAAGRKAGDPTTISYGRSLIRSAEAERDRRATEAAATVTRLRKTVARE